MGQLGRGSSTRTAIRAALLKLLHRLRPRDAAYWLGQLVVARHLQVVQIGSNDGRTGDPLHRLLRRNPNWNGLFVEPVPHLFTRLQANYGASDRFKFENAAVNDGQCQTFYSVDEDARKAIPDLPKWYDQLGSFKPDHITNRLPQLAPFVRAIQVTGITLTDLLRKHGITDIGILHIDTEGYDYKVLSQLDLQATVPQVILFEHKHLSQDERIAALKFLDGRYRVFQLGMDMMAVSRTCEGATPSTLRRLEPNRVRLPGDPALRDGSDPESDLLPDRPRSIAAAGRSALVR